MPGHRGVEKNLKGKGISFFLDMTCALQGLIFSINNMAYLKKNNEYRGNDLDQNKPS
jgi:hypothetical protein